MSQEIKTLRCDDVEVFPSGFRGQFHNKSKLTTEANLRTFSQISSNSQNHNQIFTDPYDSSMSILYIKGYYFRIPTEKLVELLPENATDGYLCAFIHLVDKDESKNIGKVLANASSDSSDQLYVLDNYIGFDDSNTDRPYNPAASKFYGLKFFYVENKSTDAELVDAYKGLSGLSESSDIQVLTIEITDAAIVSSALKLDSSEIRSSGASSSDLNINQEFNSDLIKTNRITRKATGDVLKLDSSFQTISDNRNICDVHLEGSVIGINGPRFISTGCVEICGDLDIVSNGYLGVYNYVKLTGPLSITGGSITGGKVDVDIDVPFHVGGDVTAEMRDDEKPTGAVNITSSGPNATCIVGPSGGQINLPANSTNDSCALIQDTQGISEWLRYTPYVRDGGEIQGQTLIMRDTHGGIEVTTLGVDALISNTNGGNDPIISRSSIKMDEGNAFEGKFIGDGSKLTNVPVDATKLDLSALDVSKLSISAKNITSDVLDIERLPDSGITANPSNRFTYIAGDIASNDRYIYGNNTGGGGEAISQLIDRDRDSYQLTYNETFIVPRITIDPKGRIVDAKNIGLTLPSPTSYMNTSGYLDDGQFPLLFKQKSETSNLVSKLDYTYSHDNIYIDLNDKYIHAPGFNGDGSNLTELNANSITSGTLSVDRLPDTVKNAANYVQQTNWTGDNGHNRDFSILIRDDIDNSIAVQASANCSTAFSSDVTINPATGQIKATSFLATSDARLKENIQPFNYNRSILDLEVKTFDFKDGAKNQIGCIAQDLQNIYPELVVTHDTGYLSINESKLVYLLLEEVKLLKAEIRELKGE